MIRFIIIIIIIIITTKYKVDFVALDVRCNSTSLSSRMLLCLFDISPIV